MEEEGNAGGASEGQCSISYSSDQEENGSQEGQGATSDGGLTRKGRASRGSATDPQSLYARVCIFSLNLFIPIVFIHSSSVRSN